MRLTSTFGIATLAVALLAFPGPAAATSNQTYKPDEYKVVTGGLSPDRKVSIRAHGNGELGMENFHIYLFRENPEKRIGALEEIVELDTAADAFTAKWTPDSQAVAIQYRVDRHVFGVQAYTLANNRAYPISGPSLVEQVTGKSPEALNANPMMEATEWTWTGQSTFRLVVDATYRGKATALVKAFGRFGKRGEDIDDNVGTVAFSGVAECELVPPSGYRVISLKPGSFSK
jgi:hypothetical protein